MGFISFLVLLAIAYLIWRVTDQLPDLIFRISEIQRDVAELRRTLTEDAQPDQTATPAQAESGAGGSSAGSQESG